MGVETGDCNIIPEREYHTYLPTVLDGNKRNVDSNKLFAKTKEISNVVWNYKKYRVFDKQKYVRKIILSFLISVILIFFCRTNVNKI